MVNFREYVLRDGSRAGANLADILQIQPGVTAVIGSGGKTTLLRVLAEELRREGKVILGTTTHFWPFEEYPLILTDFSVSAEEQIENVLQKEPHVVTVASRLENGKLTAPAVPMQKLMQLADYVLVEADGSRRLPIKAHETYEPVIPPEANRVVQVVGASGIGGSIDEVVHRPAIFRAVLQDKVSNRVTPDMIGKVIKKEGHADVIFLNQTDALSDPVAAAAEIEKSAGIPLVCGSLMNFERR